MTELVCAFCPVMCLFGRVAWLNWSAFCSVLFLGSLSNSGIADIGELCEALKTNTVVKQLTCVLYLYRVGV